jgi:hypothetical protein
MAPPPRSVDAYSLVSPHNQKTYSELKDFVGKERPDWLQAKILGRINESPDY